MIKYENRDNFRERIHTLEVTLQSGEYKGTLKQEISGNCFGMNILNFFSPESLEVEYLLENNCNLEFIGEDDDGEEWFRCILKDDEGNECEIEDYTYDLERLIVKLEIVDCKIKDNTLTK
ncbi:DUF5406 family protein [Clostridium magnum]|uniref:Uncharacterized protein n=1 Tax=Clostridium magnum DSM 2767 TaxID=1121326 RepID=A0A161WQ17_9CLOT|nr:DUF5406 family protein [Clostridium magnum]KZL88688.1 hypothetical protein CLMAG_59770 [Clostridium magnum DSM 2767]SHJ64423.1 hypothetical protein SAMN02745944_06282 [Clostridium magnum DSM 2767]